jgi:general secretion pathway protein N
VSSSSLLVPAQRLSSLGAPLNTLQPTGQMHLSWSELMIQPSTEGVDLNGKFTLSMSAIASALSPIKPLGSYLMTFDYYGKKAQLMLSTKQGPLLLAGRGSLDHGHLQFSGQASAQAGQEEKLANLLNLLGQRRVDGAKNVIALEFK